MAMSRWNSCQTILRLPSGIAVQTSKLREKNFDMIRINSKLELTNRLMRENISDEKMNEIMKEIEERDAHG